MFLSQIFAQCLRAVCNRYTICFGTLIICIGLITFLTAIMAETPAAEYSFSNPAFTTKFYSILKNSEGNLCFSPYSLQVVLAMAYSGAGGSTAAEFQKVMSFPADKKILEESVHKLLNDLQASKNVELNSANAMFLQKHYPVKSSYSKSIVDSFKSEIKSVDFNQSNETAKEVNDYVSLHTKGKISDFVPPDAFDSMTKLVLINAIYFKGAWLHQFDASETAKGDFHLDSKRVVEVEYMTTKKRFFYGKSEELKASILEMKYQGDMSMILIVPNEIEGIKQVEEKLANLDLNKITERLSSNEVILKMPKFKIESKFGLRDSLKEFGLKEMFSAGKADFGGITDNKELYVSDALQKTFIEVNEQGSEAAAATGLNFAMRMMPLPPVELHIKSPFLFYIVNEENIILFMGRLSKP